MPSLPPHSPGAQVWRMPPEHQWPTGQIASDVRMSSCRSSLVYQPTRTRIGVELPVGQNLSAPPQGNCVAVDDPSGQ
jgi:hypothetical protein